MKKYRLLKDMENPDHTIKAGSIFEMKSISSSRFPDFWFEEIKEETQEKEECKHFLPLKEWAYFGDAKYTCRHCGLKWQGEKPQPKEKPSERIGKIADTLRATSLPYRTVQMRYIQGILDYLDDQFAKEHNQ